MDRGPRTPPPFPLPRAAAALSRQPSLRVSIASSPARQSPTLIPSPTSPAKSRCGAIMSDAHSPQFHATSQAQSTRSSPKLPEVDLDATLRHIEQNYGSENNLSSERVQLSQPRRYTADFFDSDSSEFEEYRHEDPSQGAALPRGQHDASGSPNGGVALAKSAAHSINPSHKPVFDVDSGSSQFAEYLNFVEPNISLQEALAQGPPTTTAAPSIGNMNSFDLAGLYGKSNSFNFGDSTGTRPLSDKYLHQQLLQQPQPLSGQPEPLFALNPKYDQIRDLYLITMKTLLQDGNTGIGQETSTGGAHEISHPATPPDQNGRPVLHKPSHSFSTPSPEKYRSFSSPARAPTGTKKSTTKNVSLKVPPPIHCSNGTFPKHPVLTPYPFLSHSTPALVKSSPLANDGQTNRSSHVSQNSQNPDMQEVNSVLALSVQRTYAPNGRRVARLVVPVDMRFSKSSAKAKLHGPEENEKHFATLDFDDARFFRRLRQEYYTTLLGRSRISRWWRRWGSARTMKRIVVVTMRAEMSEDQTDGAGALHSQSVLSPRSPRFLARTGFSDTFSEEQLLQHFRRPAAGKGRYAWVHWAHRLARCADGEALDNKGDEDDKQHGTFSKQASDGQTLPQQIGSGCLEFVEGWCIWRMSLASLMALVASVAGLLLWVFLGPSPSQRHSAGQLVDAGDRVATGFVMSIGVLLFGWTGVGLWIALSWLLM